MLKYKNVFTYNQPYQTEAENSIPTKYKVPVMSDGIHREYLHPIKLRSC